MSECFVPLGGAHEGAYGALFCRCCLEFLGYEDEKCFLSKYCPSCKAGIDYGQKMKYANGKWKKVEE